MKYFTPDLLARFGSTDDRVAADASEQWEGAHQAYREHLDSIHARIPKAVRSLLGQFNLHDARVLAMGLRGDDRTFSIILQLDSPRRDGLQISYQLAAPLKFVQHQELSGDSTALGWWLYDELDRPTEEPFSVYTHSILLTGGWEVQLAFYALHWARYGKIVSPGFGRDAASTSNDIEALLT